MFYIRGATTVTEDTKDEVLSETKILLNEIIARNSLDIDNIISIIFTATIDIKSVYPAVAARELGITNAGLMCMQEMYVSGSLPKCIRILIHVVAVESDIKHVYMNEAKKLRPDLMEA